MKCHMNLSRAEKKAFDKEINRQMQEWIYEHQYDMDKITMYLMHKEFGFGYRRLKRFWYRLHMIREEMAKQYGEDFPGDIAYQCDIDLNDIGVNVEQWGLQLERGIFDVNE